MKNLKKVLALGLSATMVSSMFVTAGAAFTDQADIKATEAVSQLAALGVINGYEDGSYKPETVVTRAEMAKMIFVVRNNKVDDSAYENISTKFADIKGHWAAGYIKFCESQGIIAGKTATQFDPDAPVTGVEAAKMLLVLTGYTPDKAGLTGSMWATNTLKFAAEAGILDDVNSALEQGLPRQYAAQEIYNTLDAYRVKWSDDSSSFDYVTSGLNKEKVGRKYMGIYTSVGTLTGMSKDSITLTMSSDDESLSDATNAAGTTYAAAFSKVGADYSALLGQKVKVMFKDAKTNNVLGVYATDDNTSYTVAANGTEKDDDKVKFGGKSYSVELLADKGSATGTAKNAIRTYVDGVETAGTTLTQLDQNDLNPNMYTFADTDSNGKIDTLVVKTYFAADVTYVSSSKIIAGSKTYNFDDENIASGLTTDDWVIVSKNLYKDNLDVVKADMITGAIKGVKSTENDGTADYAKYSIDGTWYAATDNARTTKFNTLSDITNKNTSDIKTVKAGDTVKAVNVNGILFYLKRTSAADAGTLTDVALVIKKDSTINGNQVKLQFFDDTTKVVDVDDDSEIPFGAIGATDPTTSVVVGTLYAYTVSGDEYSFEDPVHTDDYYGDYTYKGTASYTIGKDNLTGVSGTSSISDKAKVIIYGKTNNDTKFLTGKQFKALTSGDVTSITNVKYFTADVDGLNKVAAITATVGKLPTTTTSNDYYAYIVDDAYKSGSNEITYTIWNGSENVTVTEKKSSAANRGKNTLIGYGSLSDAKVKVIDDVTAYGFEDSTNFAVDAVTGVNTNGTKVTLSKMNSYEYDVDNDTKVFYVDSDASSSSNIGVASASIKKADDYADVKDGLNINGKVANVLALTDGSDHMDVLVVDVQNKMVGSTVDALNAQAATINNTTATATYGTALNGYTGTLTLNNAVTATTNVTTVVKDATGTTVTPTGLVASGAQITKDTKTSALTLTTTTATPAGVYTVVYTADGVSATVTLTVAAKELANANDLGIAGAAKPVNAARVSTVGTITAGTGYTASVKYVIAGYETTSGLTLLKTGDTVKVIVTLTADTNHTFATAATTTTTMVDGAGNAVTATPAVTDNGKTLTLTYDLGTAAAA